MQLLNADDFLSSSVLTFGYAYQGKVNIEHLSFHKSRTNRQPHIYWQFQHSQVYNLQFLYPLPYLLTFRDTLTPDTETCKSSSLILLVCYSLFTFILLKNTGEFYKPTFPFLNFFPHESFVCTQVKRIFFLTFFIFIAIYTAIFCCSLKSKNFQHTDWHSTHVLAFPSSQFWWKSEKPQETFTVANDWWLMF